MSDLDQATAFFTSFFELESGVRKANLEGAKSFDELHARMTSMLADDTVLSIPREDDSDLLEEFKEAQLRTAKEMAPRTLFAVARFSEGERQVYCAYASEPRRQQALTAFMKQFWADDTMQIVATDFPCPECSGTGKVQATRCPDCEGKAWIHATGAKIEVGKPIEVRKFQRPTKAESAEQYDDL
mgnify:CR=1 FL=1